MAEPVGLVIGTVALASLFTTCIDCVDYVTLARNHGKDYEVAFTKMLLLKARLAAWGTSVRAEYPGTELQTLKDHWDQVGPQVIRSLEGIQSLFEDSDKLEKQYGLVSVNSAGSDIHPSASASPSEALQQIENTFTKLAITRQKQTSLWKKARWAIHDKKKFDALTVDVAFFVDNLEKVCNTLTGLTALDLQHQALSIQLQAVTRQDSIILLQEAAAQADTNTTSTTQKDGHLYLRTVISEQANVIIGDVGDVGSNAAKHELRDTKVSGTSNVVMGNVKTMPQDFFRRGPAT